MSLANFKTEYETAVALRASENVPPLPLTVAQTKSVIDLLKFNLELDFAKDLLLNRVLPGVDDAAQVKAAFLEDIITKRVQVPCISPQEAIKALGSMVGGYNVEPLINALSMPKLAPLAAKELSNLIYVYDNFEKIAELSATNEQAKEVMQNWANATWFKDKEPLAKEIKALVFKVPGETNTDDLSPAADAFTRSDIPLHANAMLKSRVEGHLEKIASAQKRAKELGAQVAYVGDVVGTGSSRKSACNSIMWHFGEEIPRVPNKKRGGLVLGSVIAPIFFNTAEDGGMLPIVTDTSALEDGDIFLIKPYEGELCREDGSVICNFKLQPNTIFDEYQAGGRISLIIGRKLTAKARKFLGLDEGDIFEPTNPANADASETCGYSHAQKIIGRACGKEGVRPGEYCEPETSTVGSQDTTGAMTRDEVKEMAALSFGADFYLQSFCHTAAYPKPADVKLHASLPYFTTSRGGVALKPKDGVIHSWLNRFVLPDTLGTGGDSHTRFPIGISFPAGSGLVAFAGVNANMPINVPQSVLVRFSGELQPGITLRDLVNAIPHEAIKRGLLTVEKKGKKNVFNGRILEIEGLPHLKVEQAFELSDASAERSAAACCVLLDKEPILEYLHSNIALIEAMIKDGYQNPDTLKRRAQKMREWCENPVLLQPDKNACYAEVLEINMSEITEPIVACPNDPDDVATLSEVLANENRPHKIDEVFLGSCMTNIGLFRAFGEIVKNEGQLPTRVWVAPPTKMDEKQLTSEGYYSVFGASGARMEAPGCSLCMGNQARVRDGAVVFSTSTRNFDNRMGKGAKVYLGSAELAAVCALLGRIPTADEYVELVTRKLNEPEVIYQYLNFHKMEDFAL